MEIVIGTDPGQLAPSFFASEVILAGNPTKSINITGGNLASGTKLELQCYGDEMTNISFGIYGTTMTAVAPDYIYYTYP
jgi:hypothetical protein